MCTHSTAMPAVHRHIKAAVQYTRMRGLGYYTTRYNVTGTTPVHVVSGSCLKVSRNILQIMWYLGSYVDKLHVQ